jgi:hypothetical protein
MTKCIYCQKEFKGIATWCDDCYKKLTVYAIPKLEDKIARVAYKMVGNRCTVCFKYTGTSYCLNLNSLGVEYFDPKTHSTVLESSYWKDSLRIKNYLAFLIGCCKFTCADCTELEPLYNGLTKHIYEDMILINAEKKRLDLFNTYKCTVCNFNLRTVWNEMKDSIIFPDILLARLAKQEEGIGFRGIIRKDHSITSAVACMCRHCQKKQYILNDLSPVYETGHFITSQLLVSQIVSKCDCILQVVTLNGSGQFLRSISTIENEQDLLMRDGVVRHWSEVVYNDYTSIVKIDNGMEMLVSEKAIPFLNITI